MYYVLRIIAVSYTHLDVYKRQQIRSVTLGTLADNTVIQALGKGIETTESERSNHRKDDNLENDWRQTERIGLTTNPFYR